MKEDLFQDCLTHWKNASRSVPFWDSLAEKWGVKTGETLRYQFKHERNRRGIKKEALIKRRAKTKRILVEKTVEEFFIKRRIK